MNQSKVLMLGDSLHHQGGIVTVEKTILNQAPDDIQIRHISTREDGSSAHKVLVFGQAVGELLWRLLHKEADLIHIHVAERGSAFRKAIVTLIGSLFGKPIILHAHGPEFPSFYAGLPQWTQQGLSGVFRKCACFIVLSDTWKNFYTPTLGLKAEQVIVLPNPIKLPSQVPHRSDAQKVNFIFLGRIGQRKGTFDLIKAFAALPAEYKARSELTLAGDGDVEPARKLVEDSNLTDNVTVLDWVSPDRRDALLAKANVFVLPSYSEGLPMALLEAMGWGLPAITTPVGGIPDLVAQGQNGLLVNPGDIQQLSEAMQSLIGDESLRLRLGNAARICVTPLDVEHYCCSLFYTYRSLLDHQGAVLQNTAK